MPGLTAVTANTCCIVARPPWVPTYRVAGTAGSIARAPILMLVRPVVLSGHQLAPPSALLNRPSIVPAYKVEGVIRSMAKALIGWRLRPLLAGFQLAPPSALLNKPSKAVTA